MTVPEGFRGLRFPCECVSSRRGGYSEPWAAVAKNKLLPNGTKEEILNLVAQEPRTISQLAEALTRRSVTTSLTSPSSKRKKPPNSANSATTWP